MLTHHPRQSIITTVDLDKLTVDPRVQRSEGIKAGHLADMVARFDPDAMGLLIVSARDDGTYVVLDGMHRKAAAQQVGWTGVVDARVFHGLTLAEEASLFLLYNNKIDPSAISRFNARVIAGEDIAVAIDEIARQWGFVIQQRSSSGSIAAIDALERVYRTGSGTLPDGEHPLVLKRVLWTLRSAWGFDVIAAQSVILGALGQLYGRYGDAVDRVKLVKVLQDTQPRTLVGDARNLAEVQGGTVPAALAKVLVGKINKGRRTNRLPEWTWVH